MGVSQVRREVVHMEYRWKRLAESQDCFQVVLVALEERMEMTAPVL